MSTRIFTTMLLIGAIGVTSFAQAQTDTTVQPPFRYISHDPLEIGDQTTTVLIFPAAIQDADAGNQQVYLYSNKNILKVKATRPNFTPTNLHVTTVDGVLYAFDLSFNALPVGTTVYIRKGKNLIDVPPSLPATISGNAVSENQPADIARTVAASDPFFHRSSRKFQMKLTLHTIHATPQQLWFGIRVRNGAALSYEPDFVRLYIRDRQGGKRTSVQQTELIPLYKELAPVIEGHGETQLILAVEKFTIPEGKELILELYEKSGGRNITLTIKNKHLLQAQLF